MLAELIDRVYEAALLPEKWVDTLEQVGAASGSAAGTIVVYPFDSPPRGFSTALTRASFELYCASDAWRYTQHTTRSRELFARKIGTGFVCDVDVLTPEQYAVEPVVAALRQVGLGWQVASRVCLPDDELAIFTFERRVDEGRHSAKAMSVLDSIRPHLARAALVAARLGLERAKAAVATLETIGLPAAVLKRSGRVLAGNGLLDRVGSAIVPTAGGGIAIAAGTANAAFRDAIATLGSTKTPAVQSIPVPRNREHGPLIVHLLPIRRAARDILTGGDLLMIVTEIGRQTPPGDAILANLFDLTPAEARVAACLAGGATVAETATELSIAISTVRTQLRTVFAKTGTTRQADLVNLVSTMRRTPS